MKSYNGMFPSNETKNKFYRVVALTGIIFHLLLLSTTVSGCCKKKSGNSHIQMEVNGSVQQTKSDSVSVSTDKEIEYQPNN